MPITLAEILDGRVDILERAIPIIELEDFDQSVRGDAQANLNLNRKHYEVHEELRRMSAHIYEGLGIIKETLGTLGIAVQRLVVDATNLSTTTVTDDTITTASVTPVAFDWQDARRISRIVLSPGKGVRSYGLIYDINLSDKDDYRGVMFGAGTNKLQRVGWNEAIWEGKAFDIGWTCDLVQLVVGDLKEL